MKTKMCRKCEKRKNVGQFYKNRQNKDGLWNLCKTCSVENGQKRIAMLKDRKRENIVIPEYKKCSRCKTTKPFTGFCRHICNKDGLNNWCKECVRKYYERHVAKKKQYDKHRRQKFRDGHWGDGNIPNEKKCYCCKRILPVSEFVRCKSKKWGVDSRCKNCLKQYHRDHALEEKLYRDSHRSETNARARNRRKRPEIRIVASLRSVLYDALKRQRAIKSRHTMDLVGCSVDYLKKYLEDRFSPEMSWDNYGRKGWWIDHIIPCVSFDLTKPEEQRKCFHYTNLQPLWQADNLKKSSWYNGKFIRREKCQTT